MSVHWPYYVRMARRGLLLWLALRVVLFAGGAAAVGAPSVTVSPLTTLLLLSIVAVLCATDARIMREQVFEANLGTPVRAPVTVGVGTAALLEVGTAIVLGALA